MANDKWLRTRDGKVVPHGILQELTGLNIKRPAMIHRLKQARDIGYAVDSLPQQIACLTSSGHQTSSSDEIPLDAPFEEGRRLKILREALWIEQKRKQAEIKTALERREVFYLDAIMPAWSSMVIGVREALLGAIPTLVDKVLPCKERDVAVDRAEAELIRHLNRLSDFDLERTLNEQTGDEEWEFTQGEQ